MLRIHISTTSETTNIPIRKKYIESVKYPILDLKKKLKKAKIGKRNLLLVYEDEDNSLQYQFYKYNRKTIFCQQKWMPCLQKLETFEH